MYMYQYMYTLTSKNYTSKIFLNAKSWNINDRDKSRVVLFIDKYTVVYMYTQNKQKGIKSKQFEQAQEDES